MSFRRVNSFSGLSVSEQSKKAFMELKRKKGYRYVIYKIDEKKRQVLVDKTGSPVQSYADFAAAFPTNDCRYAVSDFEFVTSDNCQKSKIFFISWAPSNSRIRAKMLYATSKERFKQESPGVRSQKYSHPYPLTSIPRRLGSEEITW